MTDTTTAASSQRKSHDDKRANDHYQDDGNDDGFEVEETMTTTTARRLERLRDNPEDGTIFQVHVVQVAALHSVKLVPHSSNQSQTLNLP